MNDYVSNDSEELKKYREQIEKHFNLEPSQFLAILLREMWNRAARMGVDQGPW